MTKQLRTATLENLELQSKLGLCEAYMGITSQSRSNNFLDGPRLSKEVTSTDKPEISDPSRICVAGTLHSNPFILKSQISTGKCSKVEDDSVAK